MLAIWTGENDRIRLIFDQFDHMIVAMSPNDNHHKNLAAPAAAHSE